jgi:hypothetical protein
MQKIGIEDDFFALGGNSILTIKFLLVLQIYFDIKMADVLNLKTHRRLAESYTFKRNFLQDKLDQEEITYQEKQKIEMLVDERWKQDLDSYKKSILFISIMFYITMKIILKLGPSITFLDE